jgi:phage tail tape-measure protein
MEIAMRSIMMAGVAALALAAMSSAANAQFEGRGVVTGAAIGAGVGAVIGGPPGAVVGTIVGVAVGGPPLATWLRSGRHQECWYDRAGMRHCRFY